MSKLFNLTQLVCFQQKCLKIYAACRFLGDLFQITRYADILRLKFNLSVELSITHLPVEIIQSHDYKLGLEQRTMYPLELYVVGLIENFKGFAGIM